MGYGRARYLTAIGDVVNTASRLETLTKEYNCQLVVSDGCGQFLYRGLAPAGAVG
jgi:class 3 adenylate cyclase